MSTITLGMTFVAMTCCRAECSMAFAVPSEFNKRRRDDHKSFCCPAGHWQSYTGKNEAEKLRDELASAQKREQWAREDAERHFARAQAAQRSSIATRGHLTRIKRRVAHGVCPCCQRSFANLRRHMSTKHPDYTKVHAP